MFLCRRLSSNRLLEQEVKAWRLTVQSEQGLLEDRCYQMEVTMETLRQQNLRLQGALSQVIKSLMSVSAAGPSQMMSGGGAKTVFL